MYLDISKALFSSSQGGLTTQTLRHFRRKVPLSLPEKQPWDKVLTNQIHFLGLGIYRVGRQLSPSNLIFSLTTHIRILIITELDMDQKPVHETHECNIFL